MVSQYNKINQGTRYSKYMEASLKHPEQTPVGNHLDGKSTSAISLEQMSDIATKKEPKKCKE
jgi:hypothetical protein